MNTDLTRRKVRYHLFRKKTEAAGGSSAGGPESLFEEFEKNPVFVLAGGYDKFADTWDIDKASGDKGPFQILPRRQSIADEWNQHLEVAIKPLTIRTGTKKVR